nr:hypothetical protein [Fulvimarina pelagi]
MMVRRGVQRLMIAHRVSLLPEMPLKSGRRADLVCLSEQGDVIIVEIKTSIEDLRVDRKWSEYLLHCDRFFFATHPGVPPDIFPTDHGLIVSDGYTAEVLREAPEKRLSAATRKAMMLRFARLSADRLLQAEWAANPFMTE